MKVELIIGFLCVTIIVTVALVMGYDGALASGAVAVIGGLLGWQGKKAADRRGGNVEALTASLKKASFSDDMIASIIQTIKKGR